MKKIFIFIALIISFLDSNAQELKAKITINTPKLQNVDKKVFEVLKGQLEEYLNTTKWTEDAYEPNERINVSITMNITKENGPTSFEATMNITASRPVFNSDYQTTLILLADEDISFSYEQYQPIQYSQNTFTDNISAIFSFYAYYIIGADADTFSSLGGEPYYQKAQDIQRLVPQGINGWQQGRSIRSRFNLIENTLNPRMRGHREAMYTYHRLGLDMFTINPEDAKAKIVQALDEVSKSAISYPNAMLTTVFNSSKTTEIIEIGKGMQRSQKAKVYEVAQRIDPANITKYQAMDLSK
jgi:Domain of unknown function (DUF4835)